MQHTSIACAACRSQAKSLFNALNKDQLTNISESKSCTVYRKGQILFHEGTRPLGVFCINQGKPRGAYNSYCKDPLRPLKTREEWNQLNGGVFLGAMG
ncbi:MAG: hypothetical protein AAF223_10170, partial [Bacteroidota bacterium]